MKKLIFSIGLTMIAAICICAQGDYKKSEFFVGFSHEEVDGSTAVFPQTSNDFGNTGAMKFNGFEVAGVYNFSRHIGIKGDVSGVFHGGDFAITLNPTTAITGSVNNSLYNVLGGIQFKDNASTKRLKPFAHVLVGFGQARVRVNNVACSPAANCGNVFLPFSTTETNLAGAVGAGLDLRLNDRFDLRLIQADYNPVRLNSGTLQNARFSIGIVFK